MTTYYLKGRYLAKITGQQLTENRNGNPELQLRIQPTHVFNEERPPQPITLAEAGYPDNNYERTVFITLTDKTVGTLDKPGWALATLRHLGWEGTSFAELGEGDVLVGKECQVSCQHNEYNGAISERWAIFRGQSGGSFSSEAKPIAKKALRALDAKLARGARAGGKTTKAAATVTVPPDDDDRGGDDDIPF